MFAPSLTYCFFHLFSVGRAGLYAVMGPGNGYPVSPFVYGWDMNVRGLALPSIGIVNINNVSFPIPGDPRRRRRMTGIPGTEIHATDSCEVSRNIEGPGFDVFLGNLEYPALPHHGDTFSPGLQFIIRIGGSQTGLVLLIQMGGIVPSGGFQIYSRGFRLGEVPNKFSLPKRGVKVTSRIPFEVRIRVWDSVKIR